MGANTAMDNGLEAVLNVKLRAPQRADAERAAELLDDMVARSGLTLAAPDREPVRVPSETVQALRMALRAVLDGRTVAVLAAPNSVISTSAAARILGVSRPHVTKLVDAGILPASTPGTHRRLRMADVLAYREQVNDRHAALDAVVAEADALGLYTARPKRGRAVKPKGTRKAKPKRTARSAG